MKWVHQADLCTLNWSLERVDYYANRAKFGSTVFSNLVVKRPQKEIQLINIL